MDLDVEMEDTVQGGNALETHGETFAPLPDPNNTGDGDLPPAPENSSAVLVPNKVHLRGVDILTTEDIKSYTSEHFGAADRIEWIDDTSANLVFNSETAAQDALVALSAIPIADPGQLPLLECLPAKTFTAKPDVNLQVRVAVSSDKKQAGAASRSRFYLLHPEYDPEERRRREQANRPKCNSRDRRHRQGSRGRRPDMHGEDNFAFNASFYDDPDPGRRRSPPGDTIRRIQSPDSEYSRRRNSTKELFPSRRRDDRLRDRSASPRHGRTLDDNGTRAQRVKSQLSATSAPKELFPSKVGTPNPTQLDRLEPTDGLKASDGTLSIRGLASKGGSDDDFVLKGASTARVKELFPDKFGDNAGKELFADRLEGRGKPRQKAEDLFR